jgi:Lon protease-like protein
MNIVTIGSERFQLVSVRHDQPYLVGIARPWPLIGASTERAQDQVGPLRALFHLYLRLLAQAQGHEIRVDEVPEEPRTLALLIAISMQLPMAEKQRLLREPTVPHMLLAERALLRKEHLLLGYIVQTQTKQWEGGSSGYLARN